MCVAKCMHTRVRSCMPYSDQNYKGYAIPSVRHLPGTRCSEQSSRDTGPIILCTSSRTSCKSRCRPEGRGHEPASSLPAKSRSSLDAKDCREDTSGGTSITSPSTEALKW
eukprot:364218-Chlamydomonas_euryale.AAC.2